MGYPMAAVDLTQPLEPGMPVYPGDEPLQLWRSRELETDGYTNHRLNMGMHVGTHLDMPMHMVNDARYVRELPLQRTMGPATILDVRHQEQIAWRPEYANIMRPLVLLWTGWDMYYGTPQYYTHPSVSLEFAERAWEAGMRLLAMDMPSPDGPPFPIHHFLFHHDVVIVENVTGLGRIRDFANPAFAAIPLNIQADASPVRAFAWDMHRAE